MRKHYFSTLQQIYRHFGFVNRLLRGGMNEIYLWFWPAPKRSSCDWWLDFEETALCGLKKINRFDWDGAFYIPNV